MLKLLFAAALAITMTVTASAHIWNRPAASQSFGQASYRASPCPINYAFQRGFCVKAPAARSDWFRNAIERIL